MKPETPAARIPLPFNSRSCPSVTDGGLSRQWHPGSDCPQQAAQRPSQGLRHELPVSPICAFSMLALDRACSGKHIGVTTTGSTLTPGQTGTDGRMLGLPGISQGKLVRETAVSLTPLSGCGKIKGTAQQLAALASAWKPGFWS